MYAQGRGGTILYVGSVHSKEASKLKAPYVAAKHGLIGLAKTVAKEGAEHGVRANVICPGFVRTPLVEKQIPEQAKELGISEDDVIRDVMLKETVDGEFTTLDDVAALRRLPGQLPVQCAHRPVDRREPRLVDAVTASRRALIEGTIRMNMPFKPQQAVRRKPRLPRGRPPISTASPCSCRAAARSAPIRPASTQALAEADLHPDWVAGISIGAINAALIAGNPPEARVEKLRSFWETITADPLGRLVAHAGGLRTATLHGAWANRWSVPWPRLHSARQASSRRARLPPAAAAGRHAGGDELSTTRRR